MAETSARGEDRKKGFWSRLFSSQPDELQQSDERVDACEHGRPHPDEMMLETTRRVTQPSGTKNYTDSVDVVTDPAMIHEIFGEDNPPIVCHPVKHVTGRAFDKLDEAAMEMARYIFSMAEPYGYEWGCVFAEDGDGRAVPSVLVTQNKIGAMGSAIGAVERMMRFPVMAALHSHPGRHGSAYKSTGPSDGDKYTAHVWSKYYGHPYRIITLDYESGNVEMYIGTPEEVWEPGLPGRYKPVGEVSGNILIGNVKAPATAMS